MGNNNKVMKCSRTESTNVEVFRINGKFLVGLKLSRECENA